MNIRRQRVHQNGLANIDRSATSEMNDYNSNLPILQISNIKPKFCESKNRSNSIQVRTQISFKNEQNFRKILPILNQASMKSNQNLIDSEIIKKNNISYQGSLLAKDDGKINKSLINMENITNNDKIERVENQRGQEYKKYQENQEISGYHSMELENKKSKIIKSLKGKVFLNR